MTAASGGIRRERPDDVGCGSSINSRANLPCAVFITLEPFRLDEVRQYLQYRRIRWDQRQIVMAYMAFGGIPHYLNLIRPSQSAAQCIEAECFRPEGMLRNDSFSKPRRSPQACVV